jgi:P4 family phage/plasmid primase-like protien
MYGTVHAASGANDIDKHKFSVTLFTDQFARKKDLRQWTLAEMRDAVLSTSAPTKRDLPWLKLATFGSKKTKKGSFRHDENAVSVSGLELDYDAMLVSFDEVVARLSELGIRTLVYTSPSNTKTQPKFRIIAPLSCDLPPLARKIHAARLAGALGITFDPASFALSQSFYYGAARDNGEADHRAVVVDGDFIDLRDDLAQFDKAAQPTSPRPPPQPTSSPALGGARGFEAHLALVGDGPGLEGFNNPLRAATGAYARQHGVGLDRAALKLQLQKVIKVAPKKSERPQHEIDKYLGDCYLDNLIATAINKFGTIGVLLPDKDHMARARTFHQMQRPHLMHYRGTYWDYHAGAYSIVDDGIINADTWSFLDRAAAIRGKGKDRAQMPFQPNRTSVAETIAALRAVVMRDPKIATPSWLNGETRPPEHLISFPNGILDLRDNRLHPPDPSFFTIAALGFDYVATAPEPINWKRFLSEIYAGEDCDNEIEQVQEMFGYLLTSDVSQEKAFFFIGAKRSGKGTMLRMLQSLLASSAVAGPTLKSLGAQFGLQPLIGKQVAIVDDLRVGSAKDTEVLIENVLKITGRGWFTIDRKYTAAWEGTLPVKLVFISNVMPKLGDDSGALASRFIISNTTQSFYGRENQTLFEEKLRPELPGVFHWALEGLRRLRERGHFKETAASRESKSTLAKLGSPVLGFIEEKCDLNPDKSVPKGVIYMHWSDYCKANGLYQLNKEHFFSALYAASGGKVRAAKMTVGHSRLPSVSGIDMNQETQDRAAKVRGAMRDGDELPF